MAKDKIIHALHAIDRTIGRTTPAPTDEQLTAIKALCIILKTYTQQPKMPPPPWVPAPVPTPPPVPEVPPSGVPPAPTPCPTPPANIASKDGCTLVQRGRQTLKSDNAPIATCTKEQLATSDQFTLLTDPAPDAAPSNTSDYMALTVLDSTTGHMLEQRQLRTHTEYKAILDKSYANELRQLCQGIGTKDNNPTTKHIDGTNTFRPITYNEIPQDR
jgi:hypothetical protein